MQTEHVTTFIALIELDQRIIQLNKELAEGVETKTVLDQDLAHINEEVKEADRVVREMQKQIDSLDLDLKVLEGKQERTKEKLMTISSQKELDSLEHEKADLAKKRREFDEQGMVLLEELERAQKLAAALLADKPEKMKKKQQEIDELTTRLERVEKLDTAYNAERTELNAHVPAELIERYDTMKLQVPNPVVPVIKDGCSGCFYGLSKPELVKVQHGDLVTCQGCYRTLYITKVADDEEQPEQ